MSSLTFLQHVQLLNFSCSLSLSKSFVASKNSSSDAKLNLMSLSFFCWSWCFSLSLCFLFLSFCCSSILFFFSCSSCFSCSIRDFFESLPKCICMKKKSKFEMRFQGYFNCITGIFFDFEEIFSSAFFFSVFGGFWFLGVCFCRSFTVLILMLDASGIPAYIVPATARAS